MDYFSNNILQNNYYGNNLAAVNSNDQIPGFNVMVHHTWSISPSLVFDQHFSWAHSESNRTEPSQRRRRPIWVFRPASPQVSPDRWIRSFP